MKLKAVGFSRAKSCISVLGFCLALSLNSACVDAKDEHRAVSMSPISGTRVSLRVPPGFEPAVMFSGLQQESSNSSVMVTEMPAPADKLMEGVSESNFAASGIQLLSKEDIEVGGLKGVLLRVRQSVGSVEFEKWITIIGTDKESLMINSTFPTKERDKLIDVLKTVNTDFAWERGRKIDKTAGLVFKVRPVEPFKLADRVQNTLLFTKDGIIPAPSIDDPIFVVGQSFGMPPVSNKEKFAKNRLLSMKTVENISEEKVADIQVCGIKGIEIKATGKDCRTNESIYVYQAILFGDSEYVLTQGRVSEKRKDDYARSFETMTRSLEIKL